MLKCIIFEWSRTLINEGKLYQEGDAEVVQEADRARSESFFGLGIHISWLYICSMIAFCLDLNYKSNCGNGLRTSNG
jgi:hypothetical protein